jgi:chaperonin GroEL (HSP60 family)
MSIVEDVAKEVKEINQMSSTANTITVDVDSVSGLSVNTVKEICVSNVVSEKRLKEVQQYTLNHMKDYLAKTYGPMGSYTAIISGTGKDTIQAEYSKDGLKVLKNILFDSPIELSIQSELREICNYVEKKVGDGTTSAVIISSLIYNELLSIMEKKQIPPRKMIKEFKSIVETCKELILTNKRDITLDDIYNICMISTNGNEEVSRQIENLYKRFGFDVSIDVGISNDSDTKIKIYDGLTVGEGYSDPAYINDPAKGTCTIHNASVYAFQDPVDTPEMISFMEKIIMDNIINPASNGEKMIPTVIVAPLISRDTSGVVTNLITVLYEYNKQNNFNQKPPIMILTNLSGTDEEIAADITRLCNCKYIKKYINPEIQKQEQDKGNAPTGETIHNFAGHCEEIVADAEKTKFINPEGIKDGSHIYDTLISFLQAEIKNAKEVNEDKAKIGRLKKRLRCLQANMIEYLVGGISVSDRDSLRDLVEDAVKNCASAAENGVGRAANFEGLEASMHIVKGISAEDSLRKDIAAAIFNAYYEATEILYGTVLSGDDVDAAIVQSLVNGYPFDVMDLIDGAEDVSTIKPGKNVLCSIETDIQVLDAISKIITIMVTSNQCLLQTTQLNRY